MPTLPSILPVAISLVGALALTVAKGQAPPPADGLPPEVPREFLERYRRTGGDQLRFCVYPAGVTGELDRAVAMAIGETLLVEVQIFEVDPIIDVPGLATIPISEEELFVHLSNNCDAFLGFTLGAGVYDPWVTFSRPYVQTRFIAVTTQDGPERLADLEPGSIVGTTMLTEGDAQVGAYNRSLPEERRWRQFPYPHAPLLIERLFDGTVEVGVAWEPAIVFSAEMLGVDPKPIPADPIRLPTRTTGLVLRSDQLYIRDALDAAIEALLRDGRLAQIYEEVGFPGALP